MTHEYHRNRNSSVNVLSRTTFFKVNTTNNANNIKTLTTSYNIQHSRTTYYNITHSKIKYYCLIRKVRANLKI